mmetsp:Transcript_63083/g.173134  ORF Transcript_63083/g.173134 Transcript_63083/m.173134 type:complete len:276 (+) Transcript_63083:691-1518(+)
MNIFTFYGRWLCNIPTFLNVWGPILGLYTFAGGIFLVLCKLLVLNPPCMACFQTRRRYDIQLPMNFCMSQKALPLGISTRPDAERTVKVGDSKREFWRWFHDYFVNMVSAIPNRVRTARLTVLTKTPDNEKKLWYEQVNVPLVSAMGVHLPLPPVCGEVHSSPADEKRGLTLNFHWWSTHWGVGTVVATPHPDPDIECTIWFRASFMMWPFLGWMYDLIVKWCLDYYIKECIRIGQETGTLDGEYEIIFTKVTTNHMINRIVSKGHPGTIKERWF